MSRRLVWIAMQDDDTAAKLVEIARKHVSLALEHQTSKKRKEAIQNGIEFLRTKRDDLLFPRH